MGDEKKEDMLISIFRLREEFMLRINEKIPNVYPPWPVTLSDKASQQSLRESALKGVEEMFEALQHLKDWKPHRMTEVKEFNREEFLEETVDAFNYFFSLLVMMGVTPEEFFNAYVKKDITIHRRLETGY